MGRYRYKLKLAKGPDQFSLSFACPTGREVRF